MSEIEIPRWPKVTLFDDPDEEGRAKAMRVGTFDETELYLGTPPGFATLLAEPPRIPRRFDSHGLEREDDGSGPFDALKRYAAQRSGSDQAAPESPAPSLGRRLLNSYSDLELAVSQGLSERDLRDAEPLPKTLAHYDLPRGQGNWVNIRETEPFLREAAKRLGIEVVVRRSNEQGEYGFALRPKAASRLVDGEGVVADALNKGAQVADGMGRVLGLNAAGPVGGAARASVQAAKSASAVTPDAKIVLTGKELGEFGDDLKAWIRAGSDAYKRLRDQGPVHNEAIGEVRLTGVGLKEMRHTGTDPRKWQLIPALPDIIRRGELINTSALTKPRPDGIAQFHWLEADVLLGNQRLRVGVNIGTDVRGNKFYNLNHDLDDWARKYQPPGVGPVIKSGVPGAAGGRTSMPDVGPLDDGINLYILGPATGSAAHAITRSHDEER